MNQNLSLSLIYEIARWKAEGFKDESNSFNFINSLVDKGFYITFTNNPNKIGFNPTGQDIGNPKGFYGFPIDKKFIETIPYNFYQQRNFIVIWKPKDNLNIINWKNVVKMKDFKRESFSLTRKLIKLGYDGVLSSQDSGNSMSGDISSELVVFKPSNVEVIKIFRNSLLNDYEAFKNSLEVQRSERLKNRAMNKSINQDEFYKHWRDSDEQMLNRWMNQEKHYKNNARKDRKNISI